jgi:NADH-quinone oxidoreductase subunit F
VLTKYVREPNSFTLDFYLQHEGYEALKTALGKKPDEIIELVKASGLRGRGGAGFPTGMKWQFVDKKTEPRYIVCNADESEPGTVQGPSADGAQPAPADRGVRDRLLRDRREGRLHLHPRRVPARADVLERAIDEAYARGILGRTFSGSGFDCDVYVHRGAGAYEAGEETALLESLEGKRAQPRNKPPFPAWSASTASRPRSTTSRRCATCRRSSRRARVVRALGPEKNGGPKLYCVSGHVKKPGVFEASMNITLRELIEGYAGGVREGGRSRPSSPADRRCRS